MRTVLPALLGLFSLLHIATAQAACGPDAIGTARTIKLDPAKISQVHGKEKALGLRDKEVILTFDDGPVPGSTPRILDTLSHNCVKATFFSVGKMARAYPEIARRIVRKGHTLAHHTHAHNRLTSFENTKLREKVVSGISLVQKAAFGGTGDGHAETPFFRYPYLARNARTDKVIRDMGLIAFGTNVDSLDWKDVAPSQIVSRVMSILKREGRGIILMHDIHTRTANALPMLLDRLREEGYSIVHVVPGEHDPVVMVQADPLEIPEPERAPDRTIVTASIPAEPPAKWKIRKTPDILKGFIIPQGQTVPVEPALASAEGRKEFRLSGKAVNGELAPQLRDWVLRSQLLDG